MRVCAIDCGSNSFHLLIADIDKQDQFKIIADDKSLLHLGAEVASDGEISDASLSRARKVMRHYKTLIQRHDVDIVKCVATSAIRSASNGAEIITSLSKTLGEEIKVISGKSEAEIIFRGISAVSSLPETRVLNIDMGGGSLELMAGQRYGLEYAASEPLGASRLARELKVSDPLTAKDISNIEKKCDKYFKNFKKEFPSNSFSNIVVSSGTLNALIAMGRAKTDGYESVTNSNISVSSDEMTSICDLIIGSNKKARKQLLSYDKDRDEFIQTAAVIAKKIEGLAQNDSPWYSSPFALREGLVLKVGDDLLNNNLSSQNEIMNATVSTIEQKIFAVESIQKHSKAKSGKVKLSHSEKVEEHCVKLFKALKELHGLSGHDLELLKYGARLHNIGTTISRSRYEIHGAYILFNTALPGFSPNDATLLRSLVRCHRTRDPRLSDNLVGRLDDENLEKARWLTAILRIADGADAAKSGFIDNIKVTIEKDKINIRLISDEDSELEIYSTRLKKALLEELSGREVTVS